MAVVAQFGAFTLDSGRRQLTRGDLAVHLTPKAFDLLELLIAEAPRVVRKAELHERLWPGTFVSDSTLIGLVKELRRALDDRDPSAPIVRTAHAVGYAFAAPIERTSSAHAAVARWIVAGTRRVALSDGENVIGRDPIATVFLDMPGVSRRHARIIVSDDQTMLEDLGSKNGTKLRDQPVTVATRLRDGDSIEIGPVVIVYHASASGISTETVERTPRT
jgi:DNA-binding winged helix-turn-helix (wHTH) protein